MAPQPPSYQLLTAALEGTFQCYGGQVASGVLKKADEVIVLASGMTSRIAGIDLFDEEVDEAFPPMSVTVRLEDDVDVSRGDMIAR